MILCVANFRAQKGHRELIRAFAGVRAEIPHARLLLVGSGPLEAETRAMVDEIGLTGCVDFVGPTNDVAQYLAAADVFALASRYEPQGIAVIEAMASGLPVVATAVGGIVETIAEDETGFLVRPGDVEGLARALVRLLRSPELRARIGTAARDLGSRSFDGRDCRQVPRALHGSGRGQTLDREGGDRTATSIGRPLLSFVVCTAAPTGFACDAFTPTARGEEITLSLAAAEAGYRPCHQG